MTEILQEKTPRETALQVLVRVLYKGAFANLALDRALKNSRLAASDRALVTELVNGTIRMKLHLEWVLKLFLTRPERRLAPNVEANLLMSIYQLLFLDRIPDYAVINEAVELAKLEGADAGRFVNGVLRNIARNLGSIEYPDKEKEPLKYLSVVYSHPDWLVSRWLNNYGWEPAVRFLRFNNSPAPLTVRVNTLRIDLKEMMGIFAGERVKAHPSSVYPAGVIIEDTAKPIMEMEAYKKGLFYVQSEATMLISQALAPEPGDMVFDMCCGVGGKSTHLAELMLNKGKVKAFDIYDKKLNILQANCRRLGISIVEPVKADILTFDFPAGSAAGVLLDAPCTGLGVLRARSDLRWRRKPSDIQELSRLQEKMLERAAAAVKPGGFLVYSTCTLEPEETEQVVQQFMTRHREFEFADLQSRLSFFPFKNEDREEAAKGRLAVFPPEYQIDGIYIALMRRKDFG